MLKRRTFWIVVVLCVLLAGAGAAMLKKQNRQTTPAAAQATAQAPAALEFLPSDVTTVQPRELRQLLPLSGSLRAVNQAAVKARVGGEVREVLVREGEAVKAGQILVRMDVSDYQARVEQAKGALSAARGQLDIAVKARDNNKALLEKGFISKNAFDTATSQYDIARANVESAKGALDVAQKALADTTIRAPISGLVSSRMVQPGEKVSPDNRLLDVVDLSRMELEAAVPAADIMNVSLDQEVQVRIEGLDAPLTGKVVRINPATQTGSRSILAYIQIDNPQGALRVGMFGEAQLTLAKRSAVLSVPQSAIRNNGSNFVYVIENGVVTQKPVELGLRGDDGEGGAVEVVSGLKNGDLVVKNNLGNLKTGTAARVLQAGTATAAAGAGVVRK
ncbi:MAG TPA: efflux RND transporter periplasmic adaptor subunit [Microvirga sp.]|jgi:RND family efflux transporter MFP subunit|nr:efflux RND transporter periplasmic adaptor subunit [Microvirga sp.]